MHNCDYSQCFYRTISTDTGTFYGQKEHDCPVRVIPSDSEDSQLESDTKDSEEEWITELGLRNRRSGVK